MTKIQETNKALALILKAIGGAGVEEELFAAEQLRKVIYEGHTAFHEKFPDTSCEGYFKGLNEALGLLHFSIMKTEGEVALHKPLDMDSSEYMELHKYTLDEDPAVAVFGRLAKQLIPVLYQAITLEAHRNVDTRHVLNAFQSLMGMAIQSGSGLLAEEGHEKELAEWIAFGIAQDVKNTPEVTPHGRS